MKKRRLGNSELELTRIGLGAWAIGGAGWQYAWGEQDDRASIAAIRRALDSGINWIDTAAVYGLGHSEEIVAKAVEGRRHEVILATKCALRWDEKRQVYNQLKAASIRQEAEASLRRLKTDVIDLYQIHWPNPDADIEEAWGVLAELTAEGKIRYPGVSNFSVSQLKRIQPIHPVTSLQPPYSMIRRGIEAELLPFCAENSIGVIAYSPMASGMLTGAMTRERIGAMSGDWRQRSAAYNEPELSANLELVEALRDIAAESGRTVSQLAISWVLRRPEVTAAIVGARSPEQVAETAAAGERELEAPVIEKIEQALLRRQTALSR